MTIIRPFLNYPPDARPVVLDRMKECDEEWSRECVAVLEPIAHIKTMGDQAKHDALKILTGDLSWAKLVFRWMPV